MKCVQAPVPMANAWDIWGTAVPKTKTVWVRSSVLMVLKNACSHCSPGFFLCGKDSFCGGEKAYGNSHSPAQCLMSSYSTCTNGPQDCMSGEKTSVICTANSLGSDYKLGECNGDRECTAPGEEGQEEGQGCSSSHNCAEGLNCINHVCQLPRSKAYTSKSSKPSASASAVISSQTSRTHLSSKELTSSSMPDNAVEYASSSQRTRSSHADHFKRSLHNHVERAILMARMKKSSESSSNCPAGYTACPLDTTSRSSAYEVGEIAFHL